MRDDALARGARIKTTWDLTPLTLSEPAPRLFPIHKAAYSGMTVRVLHVRPKD
jgi:hypothetical protein